MRHGILGLLCVGICFPLGAYSQGIGSRADSFNVAAFRAFQSREFERTGALARKALESCPGTSVSREAGIAEANLGAALAVRGRLDEALSRQARADSIFTAIGDSLCLGRLFAARAIALSLKGKAEAALACLGRARLLRGGNEAALACLEASVLGNTNDAVRLQDVYIRCLGEIHRCRAGGDSAGTAICAMTLGFLDGTTGDHQGALRYFSEALSLFHARADSLRAGLMMENVGLAQRKLGSYAEARRSYQEALVMARARGEQRLAVELLNDLSMLHSEMGDQPGAEQYDREAEEACNTLAEDLRLGKADDTVLVDFLDLVQARYANMLPYHTDPFVGFCDRLALDPAR
jgi:tetratricopeptide (TPR) repeat protein